MMKFLRAISLGLLLLTGATQANAGVILGIADSNIGSSVNDQFFSNLFNGDDVYGRVNSTSWTLTNWSHRIGANGGNFSSGAISSAALTGMEWVATSTNAAWSASELAVLSSFVAGGGNVVVIGEGPAYTAINTNANAILSALGSTMSFSVTGEQAVAPYAISSDPLMAGVTTFSGGYVGSISGGTWLVQGTNDFNLVAYEGLSVPSPATIALFLFGMSLISLRRKLS